MLLIWSSYYCTYFLNSKYCAVLGCAVEPLTAFLKCRNIMAETSPENCSDPVEIEKYFLIPNGLLSFGYQYHFSPCNWACQKDMPWFFSRTLYCYVFFSVFSWELCTAMFFSVHFSSCAKWALGLFVVCANTLKSWYLVIAATYWIAEWGGGLKHL